MKKRILAIALGVLSVCSLVACGDDKKKEENKRTYAEVELGQYKGIEVDSSLKEVPQEDIDAYLESVLNSLSTTEEVKENVVFKKDDIVKLSYTCKIDGKEVESKEGFMIKVTDKGYELYSSYSSGILNGVTTVFNVTGKSAGEKYEITEKVSDKYTAKKDYVGKDAVFTVTLEARVDTIVPEFTDELVAKNFDYLKLATKQDMLDYLKDDLYVVQIYNEIIEVVMENAKIVSYDSERLAEVTKDYAEYQEYYIYYMTGYELDAYLKLIGQTEDDFMKSVEEASKEYLKQEMVYEAIAKAEGIEVTDEMIEAKKLEYAKNYGYDSVEEFWKNAGMTEEEFALDILVYEVQDFLCENVEFVDGLGLRNPEEESSSGEKESTSGENETTTGEKK